MTMIRTNKLRQLLNEDKPSLCVRVNSLWPDVVEVVGALGIFDYVEFAAEYAAYDMQGMDNFCRTAELAGLGTMVKLDQDPRMWLAQRAIGSGFESVLFVDCRTAAEVEHCVRICRPDTPQDGGLYGAAGRRLGYQSSGHAEYSQALRDVVVAIMAEKRSLVDDLENVLSIPGIDMVQWGPSDYTMSSGLQRGDPAVKEAERFVVETCLRMDVAPRIELETLDGVEYYLDMGVKHFRIGNDLSVMRRFWQENGNKLRDMLSQA
jgi:2-keto-3-deoxy-L-rhamnonate aldolase RhmA